MKTNREIYSELINDLRQISIDTWLSPQWLLGKARDIVGNFLKKDSDSLSNLYKNQEGWKEVCFDMMEVPITACGVDPVSCQKLMRSEHQLPDIFTSGRAGGIIRQVSSSDFSKIYEPTTPKGWNNIQKRRDRGTKKYYFIVNQYLFIPIPKGEQSSPHSIRFEAFFQKPWEVDKLQGQTCVKPLDYDFVCPNFLIDDVKKETAKQVAQVYLKVVQDNYPNNTANIKTNQNQ